ncbi:MAG: DMT family transporter [Betaproteobacteria bacterium]|jgi:drug/metabolite transporter (DMT)-like permease|nr:DMT family transporter [Betaproteobacteria bacterium]
MLRSLLLMVLGILLITANDAATKHLVQTYPVGQVIGLRQTATLMVLLPYVMLFSHWSQLRMVDVQGQLARGLLFIVGSALIVWSLAELPLATAITMLFLSPVFMVLLSMPMLKERIGHHRWVAVLGGFAGVLIILRPGGMDFQWALLIPLAAAAVNALRDVLTRRMSRSESSMSILFWSNIILMAGGFTTLPLGWKPVDAQAAMWIVAAGVFNGTAHFCMIEALRSGEASLLAPIRYTALLWAALFGFLIWGEVPDVWLWAGATVVVASSLYMIRHERRR